jgi:hypothetical protein
MTHHLPRSPWVMRQAEALVPGVGEVIAFLRASPGVIWEALLGSRPTGPMKAENG